MGPGPWIVCMGLLAVGAAMPAKLFGVGLHFADCWGWKRSAEVKGRLAREGNLSWAACCSRSRGGPEANPHCWRRWVRSGYSIPGVVPELVERMREEARFERLTPEVCCEGLMLEKDREVTMEIVARNNARRMAAIMQKSTHSACQLSRNRTSAARATVARARNLLQQRGVEPIGEDELPAEVPVLGFPVAFDREGLTLRLLRSVDFPVGRLLLIATGPALHLRRLLQRAREVRPDLEVSVVRWNLGCAGGWNEVMHLTRDARWWLIGSYDVAFPPGSLPRIAARTEAALQREARGGRPAPGLRTFSIRGQPKHVNSLPAFVLTRRAVATAGLFDENFWPAYAEDWDYLRRMRLAGGSRAGAATVQDFGIEIVHGPGDWTDGVHYSGIELFMDDSEEEDESEGILKAQVTKQVALADNYNINFCRKYGPLGRPGNCTDVQYEDAGPYGVQGASFSDWVLDPVLRMCIQRANLQELCFYNIKILRDRRGLDVVCR